MKKILTLLMLIAGTYATGQSKVTVQADVLKLNGVKVTGISTDSTSDSKSAVKLITEAAAKKYAESVSVPSSNRGNFKAVSDGNYVVGDSDEVLSFKYITEQRLVELPTVTFQGRKLTFILGQVGEALGLKDYAGGYISFSGSSINCYGIDGSLYLGTDKVVTIIYVENEHFFGIGPSVLPYWQVISETL